MRLKTLLLFGLLLTGSLLQAQVHFTFTTNTGSSANVAILLSANPNLDGVPISRGDEIGVFSQSGLCVGAVVWDSANTSLTVWGDNSLTPQVDGLVAGDSIYFRLWKASTNIEHRGAVASYSTGNGIFHVNGIYVLSALNVISLPPAPSLASPANNAFGVSVNPDFVWNRAARATKYRLEISGDSVFTAIFADTTIINDTSISVSGLSNYKYYWWRVSGINVGGQGEASSVFKFRTILATPVLSAPANNSVSQLLSVNLAWGAVTGAARYRVQLASDAAFNTLIVDNNNVTINNLQVGGLVYNTKYFWRVNAQNSEGTTEYSSVWNFTTLLAPPFLIAPLNNADLIPINPQLSWSPVTGAQLYSLNVALDSLFTNIVFSSDNISATNQNLSGLMYNRTYFWRVRATAGANQGEYSSVFRFKTVARQEVVMPFGWNMISSHNMPLDSNIVSVFLPLTGKFILVKDGDGNVYWPAQNINTIGDWKSKNSYQVYMSSPDTLRVTGKEIVPNQFSIGLNAGWNMPAYSRTSALAVDSALYSVRNTLVLAKNNLGQVYWPQYGINQIGTMKPGQGYQLNVNQAAILLYPANSAALLKEDGKGNDELLINKHYPFAYRSSSVNSVVLVLDAGAKDGDEAAVYDAQNTLVGAGVFKNGKAAVVIYGNESITVDIDEGAEENETLSLYTYSAEAGNISRNIQAIESYDGSKSDGNLLFENNSAYVIRLSGSELMPLEFNVYQNYPNPFNPETIISFDLARTGLVKLDIYNILGQHITSLVDEVRDAGRYQVKFDASRLPSGTYFYKLVQDNNNAIKKMTLIK